MQVPPCRRCRAEEDKAEFLVQKTISLEDGIKGVYRNSCLVVSHGWESPTEPDCKGEQLKAIHQHCLTHRGRARVVRLLLHAAGDAHRG